MTTTVDIVRLAGDYKIFTAPGGNLTIDVSSTSTSLTNTGTVTIIGNLDVQGATTQLESVNTVISDNEIILNRGGYDSLNHVKGGISGFRIDRGSVGVNSLDGRLYFDDSSANGSWTDLQGGVHRGLWKFMAAGASTMIRTAGLQLDSTNIGNTLNTDSSPRLVLIGENPLTRNAVVSVKGTTNYYLNVKDDDDIPNKKYVDVTIGSIGVNTATYAQMLVNNNGGVEAPVPPAIDVLPFSYITISRNAGGVTGRISMYIDDYLTMDVSPESVQLAELSVNGSSITPFHTGTNIYLVTNNGAEVVVNSALTYQVPDAAPAYGPNQVKVYSTSTVGQGGTGLMFVNGNQTRDELVSAKKALIFSIIF
jgi:hypothetical protein